VAVKVGESLETASWQPYSATLEYTLYPGEGPKTVYARYRTSDGEDTATVSDTILLDESPPVPTIVFPSDGFATYSDVVTFYGQVDDLSPVKVRSQNAETDDEAGTFALLEVPLDVGANRVSVDFEDAVGFTSSVEVSLWRHPSAGACSY